jgi:hypothetical protein
MTDVTEAALYIYELQVLQEYHGQGLGRHLILLMEAAAADHKMDKVMLTVFKFNPAVAFYRDGMGYSVDYTSRHNNPLNNETWEMCKYMPRISVLMMAKGSMCSSTPKEPGHAKQHMSGLPVKDWNTEEFTSTKGVVYGARACTESSVVTERHNSAFGGNNRPNHGQSLPDDDAGATALHTTVLQLIKGETDTGSVLGASLIFTGTAVGAGMLALPAEMAPAGFIPSEFALVACWAFTYVRITLFLRARMYTARISFVVYSCRLRCQHTSKFVCQGSILGLYIRESRCCSENA